MPTFLSVVDAAQGYRHGPTTPVWKTGTGTPQGVVAAPVGSLYSRLDGGTDTAVYRKEAGTDANGWVAVTNSGTGGGLVTSVDGRTGVVTLTDLYVNVTGDTMTGTLNVPVVALGTSPAASGALRLTAGASPADGIAFGGDTNLYRRAADTLATDDTFNSLATWATPVASADIAFLTGYSGAPGVHIVRGDGTHEWGTGGFTFDTNLYRSAPDTLRTDDSLSVGVRVDAPWGFRHGSALAPSWTTGSGTPEGVATAPVGSLFSRIDGGTDTTIYRKESGVGAMGWVATSSAGGVTSVDGRTGAVTMSDLYVDVAGDTMTGNLNAPVVALGTTTASQGILRLPNNGFIWGRNQANSADVPLIGVSTSNYVQVGGGGGLVVGVSIPTGTTRTLWVSNDSNPTTAVGGIYFGSAADTSLYRSAPNQLRTGEFVANVGIADVGTTSHTVLNVQNKIWNNSNEPGSVSHYGALIKMNKAGGGNAPATVYYGAWIETGIDEGSAANVQSIVAMRTHNVSVTNSYGINVVAQGSGVVTTSTGILIQGPGSAGTAYGVRVLPQSGTTAGYGIAIENASTNTLWLSSNADGATPQYGMVFGLSKDTNLYRSAANTLKTDDDLQALSFRQGASGPTWSSGFGSPEAVVTAPVGSMYSRTDGAAGTSIYRKETGVGTTGWAADAQIAVSGYVPVDGSYAATGTGVMKSRVAGNAQPQFTINTNGNLIWGDGVSAPDVNFYRTAVGQLQVNGNFGATGTITANDWSSFRPSNLATFVSSAASGAFVGGPPFSRSWHDVLRFNVTGVPVEETLIGATWTPRALTTSIFDGTETAATGIIDGTTVTAVRWTWNSTFATDMQWLRIAFGYVVPVTSIAIDVEQSNDGASWTYVINNATYANANSETLWLRTAGVSNTNYSRLTIRSTNARPININILQWYTHRVGDQGRGVSVEYPYSWNYSKQIAVGGGAPANGPLTIGTNTTTGNGGMWLGTDVNLYRSAANTLKTDDYFDVGATTKVRLDPIGQAKIAQTTGPTLGAEVLANSDFATDLSSWAAGANWAWATGGAKHTAGATATLSQTLTTVNAGAYLLAFTISGRAAGSIQLSWGGVLIPGAQTASTNFLMRAGGTSTALVITPTTDFDGSVDSVSVKPMASARTPHLTLDTTLGSEIVQVTAPSAQAFGIGWGALRYGGIGGTLVGTYAIGYMAAGYMSGGQQNVIIGETAGGYADNIHRNVLIGTAAGLNMKSESDVTAVGYVAYGGSGGGGNTSIGSYTMPAMTSGYWNTVVGYFSGEKMTTSLATTVLGARAGRSVTTGNSGVYVGHGADLVGVQADSQTVVGANSTGEGLRATTLGNGARASGTDTTSVGASSSATVAGASAFGEGANATAFHATVLGTGTSASANGAVAIGRDATANPATASVTNDFVLGTLNHNVKIPGTLAVTSTIDGLAGFRHGSSTKPSWTSGTGSPQGVVTAPVGSIYSRTDGGADTALYRKETGTGNTGWIPIADVYVATSTPPGTPDSGDLWYDTDEPSSLVMPLSVANGGTGGTSPTMARSSLSVPYGGNSVTTAGGPTTGTYVRGDTWLDNSNVWWVCTVAGSPGTWLSTNLGPAGPLSIANGGTGATTAVAARTSLAMPGEELAYNQTTGNLSVTATSSATAQTVVAGTSRSYDGSSVILLFNAPSFSVPASSFVVFNLMDGATEIMWFGSTQAPASGQVYSMASLSRKLTPSAGTHTYSVAAWISGSGAATFQNGTGNPGSYMPSFLRVTRV